METEEQEQQQQRSAYQTEHGHAWEQSGSDDIEVDLDQLKTPLAGDFASQQQQQEGRPPQAASTSPSIFQGASQPSIPTSLQGGFHHEPPFETRPPTHRRPSQSRPLPLQLAPPPTSSSLSPASLEAYATGLDRSEAPTPRAPSFTESQVPSLAAPSISSEPSFTAFPSTRYTRENPPGGSSAPSSLSPDELDDEIGFPGLTMDIQQGDAVEEASMHDKGHSRTYSFASTDDQAGSSVASGHAYASMSASASEAGDEVEQSTSARTRRRRSASGSRVSGASKGKTRSSAALSSVVVVEDEHKRIKSRESSQRFRARTKERANEARMRMEFLERRVKELESQLRVARASAAIKREPSGSPVSSTDADAGASTLQTPTPVLPSRSSPSQLEMQVADLEHENQLLRTRLQDAQEQIDRLQASAVRRDSTLTVSLPAGPSLRKRRMHPEPSDSMASSAPAMPSGMAAPPSAPSSHLGHGHGQTSSISSIGSLSEPASRRHSRNSSLALSISTHSSSLLSGVTAASSGTSASSSSAPLPGSSESHPVYVYQQAPSAPYHAHPVPSQQIYINPTLVHPESFGMATSGSQPGMASSEHASAHQQGGGYLMQWANTPTSVASTGQYAIYNPGPSIHRPPASAPGMRERSVSIATSGITHGSGYPARHASMREASSGMSEGMSPPRPPSATLAQHRLSLQLTQSGAPVSSIGSAPLYQHQPQQHQHHPQRAGLSSLVPHDATQSSLPASASSLSPGTSHNLSGLSISSQSVSPSTRLGPFAYDHAREQGQAQSNVERPRPHTSVAYQPFAPGSSQHAAPAQLQQGHPHLYQVSYEPYMDSEIVAPHTAPATSSPSMSGIGRAGSSSSSVFASHHRRVTSRSIPSAFMHQVPETSMPYNTMADPLPSAAGAMQYSQYQPASAGTVGTGTMPWRYAPAPRSSSDSVMTAATLDPSRLAMHTSGSAERSSGPPYAGDASVRDTQQQYSESESSSMLVDPASRPSGQEGYVHE